MGGCGDLEVWPPNLGQSRDLHNQLTGFSRSENEEGMHIWEPGCKVTSIITVRLLRSVVVIFADFRRL
jgi:hypothetical protein